MSHRRDIRLDLLRGVALLVICLDHIPQNAAAALTLRNFALSDAAEVFVFVSGVAAALGLGRVLHRSGSRAWLRRIAHRIGQLYATHLALVAAALVLLWLGMTITGRPAGWAATPLSAIGGQGAAGVLGVLTLSIQPELLDILPLYMVLLAALPVIHLAAERNAPATLAVSGLVWLAANVSGTSLPGWYFNPLAWQFLFTFGVVCGLAIGNRLALPQSRAVTAAAVLYLVFGLVMAAPWAQLPGLDSWRIAAPNWMGPLAKTNLSPWRLASMLSMAHLFAVFVPASAAWLRSPRLEPLLCVGRNGLVVLAVATLVDYAAIAARLAGAHGVVYQAVSNAGAIAALLLAGWLAERRAWRRGAAHRAAPAAPGSWLPQRSGTAEILS